MGTVVRTGEQLVIAVYQQWDRAIRAGTRPSMRARW